jgi:ABC-type antimicrobial peptide transport system permease subunit
MMWGIAALAILIGGVGMTNAQLMSVFERTREIGVLRAVGWKAGRVLLMILGESVLVSLLGGLVGVGLSYVLLSASEDVLAAYGASTHVRLPLMTQAFGVVFTLGLVGGLYPAYRASRLEPVEALRYEGGSAGDAARRLPVGGLALQNLWRRKTRTLLTLVVIGLTIGAIVALNSLMRGSMVLVNEMAGGAEVMVRQREAADTSVAFIDERIGDRIAVIPGVESVSGMLFAFTISEDAGMFLIQGFAPREAGIQKFQIVDGQRISTNRQIMVGRSMAEAQSLEVGDTITLGEMRFKVVGIYESSMAWEEMGGVVTLRDAQNFAGRQRKVTFFLVDVNDPAEAEQVAARINDQFPEVHASLAGEFASEMPDMQNSVVMSDTIAVMAVAVGGVGMMNAMLMSVLERTREIGVLRALGWRRRRILSLIVREALALGLFGAGVGVSLALFIAWLLLQIPTYGEMLIFNWELPVFTQAIIVALVLGLIGGLYPALRATRMQPVEALRYE